MTSPMPTQQAVPSTVKLRPENINANPNVMYEGAQLYTPPTLGVYFGWLAIHAPDRLPGLLRRIQKKAGDMALKSFDLAVKAHGVVTPPPAMRQALYRAKATGSQAAGIAPMSLWIEQRAKFPWKFQKDWADWERLEGRLLPEPPEMPAGATAPMIAAPQ